MNAHRKIETFPSRQNVVWLVEHRQTGQRQVKKTFANPQRCQWEATILRELGRQKASVPDLLAQEGNTLRLSYVDAPNACTALSCWERQDAALPTPFVTALVDELCRIHQTPSFMHHGYILDDVNWRNILWDGQRVVWLDFEETKPGHPVSDFAGLIAFLLTYDPIGSEYKMTAAQKLRRQILQATNHLPEALDAHIEKWLARLEKRRGRSFNLTFPGNEPLER